MPKTKSPSLTVIDARNAQEAAYVPTGRDAEKIAHAFLIASRRDVGNSADPMPRYWGGYQALAGTLVRCALGIPVSTVVGNGGIGPDMNAKEFLLKNMDLDWDTL